MFMKNAGEEIILQKNVFVEKILPSSMFRKLSGDEMEYYRRPFKNPGRDRLPTLTWPREIPVRGKVLLGNLFNITPQNCVKFDES